MNNKILDTIVEMLLEDGAPAREIAAALNISESTLALLVLNLADDLEYADEDE